MGAFTKPGTSAAMAIFMLIRYGYQSTQVLTDHQLPLKDRREVGHTNT